MKTEIIDKQRQQWMDKLRNLATDFITDFDIVITDSQKSKKIQDSFDELYRKTTRNGNLIIFMLNSEKSHQKEIVDVVLEIQQLLEHQNTKTPQEIQDEYDTLRERYFLSFMKIFEETWKKIKSNE